LVTGAAGFIGTHTCVDLLDAGYRVVGVDNFANSSPGAVERVRKVAARDLAFVQLDVRDRGSLGQEGTPPALSGRTRAAYRTTSCPT
jgi:UDP-glucose 4-epimerase